MPTLRFGTNYFLLFTFVLISLVFGVIIYLTNLMAVTFSSSDDTSAKSLSFLTEHSIETVTIASPLARESQLNCTYYTCFDVYRCGFRNNGHQPQISVYVYPPVRYVDDVGVPVALPMSAEYAELLKTIVHSEFYTPDPNAACILVPSIDMLNQNDLRLGYVSRVLASLP